MLPTELRSYFLPIWAGRDLGCVAGLASGFAAELPRCRRGATTLLADLGRVHPVGWPNWRRSGFGGLGRIKVGVCDPIAVLAVSRYEEAAEKRLRTGDDSLAALLTAMRAERSLWFL
jgi:hypothetical protein